MPMPISKAKARVAAPGLVPRPRGRAGLTRAALVAGVVVTMSVAVPAEAPVMATGLVAPKLSVGRF
jgi:hypothetical protein